MKKSCSMNYFTIKSKGNRELVFNSEFFTQEMAEQVEKHIPHRTVSKGRKLAFSRSGDGASFGR